MSFRRLANRLKGTRHSESGSRISGTAPAPSSTHSAPGLATTGTTTTGSGSSPTNLDPTPTNAESAPANLDVTSRFKTLQERLWNEAYDELRDNPSEGKLVEEYERILSAQLSNADPTIETNDIERIPEKRRDQMNQLLRKGLERTERVAVSKDRAKDTVEVVSSLRGMISNAVHTTPEAAVAWVGISFALELLSNIVTEPGINREGLAYVVSRMDWYWNLADLLLAKNKAEGSSEGLRLQLEQQIMQLYRKLLAYQMKSVCLYSRNRSAVVLRDAVKLDDWDGEVNEIKEDERAIGQCAYQYNNENIRSQLLTLSSTANVQRLALDDIHSAIRNQTKQQERRYREQEKRHHEEKDLECLRDLYVTDPGDDKTRIEQTKGGLLKDSYQWILSNAEFVAFRKDPDRRLLWIKADPGKGKTMLLCGIIDELQQGNDQPLCLPYFFCQATETRLNHATNVLRGLIYMLVKQVPSLIGYIREGHDIGKQRFEGPNAWQALCKILGAILEDTETRDTVILVDALDECGPGSDELIDFIIDASEKYRARWIVSSRNWPTIEDRFNAATEKVKLCLELNQDALSHAVENFIQYKVNQLARQKNYDDELQKKVHQHLAANSNNTFLWVALVCLDLSSSKVRMPRHTLKKLETSPSGLDALYERMLGHIQEDLPEEDAESCLQILANAVAAFRPLSLGELASLVEPSEDDPGSLRDMIESCGSFLTIKDNIVYFIHQSAKDFLADIAKEQIMPAGIAVQHERLFLRSLGALSETLRQDHYNVRVPGKLIKDIKMPDPDPIEPVEYHCSFWDEHFVLCESKASHAEAIFDFFQKQLLFWLEALALKGRLSDAFLALRNLLNCSKLEALHVRTLIQDAQRFLLLHKTCIETAPLQIYVSALVFTPKNTLVRSTYHELAPSWIQMDPNIAKDWDPCLQTLEGHSREIFAVAYSPSGKLLATGGEDEVVRVWELSTTSCIHRLRGHSDEITSVAFIPHGERLASSSYDTTIRIWDLRSGACVSTLIGHGSAVTSLSCASQSPTLVSTSESSQQTRIWDIETGECVKVLDKLYELPKVLSADAGQILAKGVYSRAIELHSLTRDRIVQVFEDDGFAGHEITAIAISPDGRWVAAGYMSGEGHLDEQRDFNDEHHLQRLFNHDDGFDADDDDSNVSEGDTSSHSSTEPGAEDVDGPYFAKSRGRSNIVVWDARTGARLHEYNMRCYLRIASLVFSSDGQKLVCAFRWGPMMVLETTDGSHWVGKSYWETPTGLLPGCIDFHPDGDRIAFARGLEAKVWDVSRSYNELTEDTMLAYTAVGSLDGTKLARASRSHIEVWNTVENDFFTIEAKGAVVLTFSEDSQQLAAVCAPVNPGNRVIRLWDLASNGTHLHSIQSDLDQMAYLALSGTSRLVSASKTGLVRVWDTESETCVLKLECSPEITSLAFSRDGKQLVLSVLDHERSTYPPCRIQLYDAFDGTLVRCLVEPEQKVHRILGMSEGLDQLALQMVHGELCILDLVSETMLNILSPENMGAGRVSFDRSDPGRVITNYGTFRVVQGTTSPSLCLEGYGISSDSRWIMQDGHRRLWIPVDYRRGGRAIAGTMVSVGKLLIKFTAEGFLLEKV